MAYETITVKNKVLLDGVHTVTSPFGMRKHPVTGIQSMHNGIDLIGKNGADTIVAFADGTVSSVGYDSSTGYLVKIDHGNKSESVYFHLKKDSTKVKKGDKVKAGQVLAMMGATGQVTGVHLHFGLKLDATYVDPRPYLEGKKALCLIAPVSAKKDSGSIANEVLNGLWGNGNERKTHLTKAGYDYAVIQATVNQLVGEPAPIQAAALALQVGNKILLKPNAKQYSRSAVIIPSLYKNKVYTIQKIGANDLLLKELYSWVKKDDVEHV